MRAPARWLQATQAWTPAQLYQRCALGFGVAALVYMGIHVLIFGGPLLEWPGSSGYGKTARILVDQHLYSENGVTTTVNRPPLYPFFLAGFYAVLGSSTNLGAFLAQALMWVGLGLAVVRLALRWSGDTLVAVGAAILYGTHAEFALESISQRDTLLFTVCLVLWLANCGGRMTTRRAIGLGVASGLLLLTRPTGIVFCGLLPFIVLIGNWGEQLARGLRFAGIALGSAFLLTLPWHAHIARETGGLDLLPSSTSGENLYKGSIAQFEVVYPWIDLDDLNPRIDEITAGLDERGKNNELKARGWAAIRAEPFRAVRRGFIKVAAFYSPLRTPLGEGELRTNGPEWELVNFRWNRIHFLTLPHAILLLGGSIWFLSGWRGFRPAQSKVILQVGFVTLAVTALHALTFGESRHRLPFDIFFVLAAAAAFSTRWSRREKTPPPPSP